MVWPTPSAAPVRLPALAGGDAPAGAQAVTGDGRVADWSRNAAGRSVATVWTGR